MKRIYYFFRSLIRVKTVFECRLMGLTWYQNVYGDYINKFNARSIWLDEYNNWYFCDQLYRA